MISKEKIYKLIAIYFYICDLYENELKNVSQRYSNNSNPEFSDQEVLTIYIYVMHTEERLKVKQIHRFAKEYLHSWFPLLPSYEAFIMRLNKLSEAFKHMAGALLSGNCPEDCDLNISLLDSMPIITCSGKRVGRVANDLTDKGYCSTKTMYYYGLKLHALAFRRANRLPYPESIIITPASENDLNVFKQNWADIYDRDYYGDKTYYNIDFFEQLTKEKGSYMFTPVKGIKNQPDSLKQFDKAANGLFSTAVSRIRQPIESLFNWLIEKTDIQKASKVRSTNGLLVHVFGRIAAAFIFLIFNS